MPCRESHNLSLAFDARPFWAAMLHCLLGSLTEWTTDSGVFWRTDGCAFGRVLSGLLLEEGERARGLQGAGCEEALARACYLIEGPMRPSWGNMTHFQAPETS